MSMHPCVFVVEDEDAIRDSLAAALDSGGYTCQCYSGAEAFLAALPPGARGCLVVDVCMAGMSGLELQETLNDRGVQLPTIVLTGFATTPVTIRALKNGAVTLLEKPFTDLQLIQAVEEALARDRERHETENHARVMRSRLAELTQSERAVLDMMTAGAQNKAIAYDLDLSLRTVELRRATILKKLGVDSVAALVWLVAEAEHGLKPRAQQKAEPYPGGLPSRPQKAGT